MLFAIVLAQLNNIVDNISNLIQVESKSIIVGFVTFLFLFIIVLLFHLNRWYKTTIWIENGMLIVEQNTLNRRKNTYTIKNISNIDMEQSLFERLIGTYKIKIDTNSFALAENTDIKIVLSKQKAIEFKKVIMLMMEQLEGKDATESEEQDFDIVYSAKDILFNCFYTAKFFRIVLITGTAVGLFLLIRYNNNNYTINDFVDEALGDLIAILIAVVSAVFSLVKGFFKFYGFKVRRNGRRIQLNYGLFHKNMHTIPVDKINGIKIVQPFLSRVFGRYQVEVINIGTGDENNESANLLLSCTQEEVKRYMSVLLPEFENFIDKPIERQETKYIMHIAFNLLVEFVVCVITFIIINNFVTLPGWVESITICCFIIICAVGHILSYFTVGYYIGEDYLIVSRGIFTKTFFSIRYEKMQHIQMNATFMSKVTGLKKATIFILADLLHSPMILPFLEEGIHEQNSKKNDKSIIYNNFKIVLAFCRVLVYYIQVSFRDTVYGSLVKRLRRSLSRQKQGFDSPTSYCLFNLIK